MDNGTLVSVTVIVIIAIVYFYVRALGRYNKHLPITRSKATITKKRIERWKGGTNTPTITEYYIDVEINGIKHEIKVPRVEDYEKMLTEATGILSYQKNRLNKIFVDFTPDEN